MSCPIYKEIELIRGSGLYPGDLSDDNAVVLGSGETFVAESAITQTIICRLEHLRFIRSSPTAEEATAWWNLRYSSFAGRRLTDISEETTPENCASRGIIDELLGLTRQIRSAIVRMLVSEHNNITTVTLPPDLVEISPKNCSIHELHRGLETAVRFARGLQIGNFLVADNPELAAISEDFKKWETADIYPWPVDSLFPELGTNPVSSCVSAAAALLRVYEHGVVVESKGLELARIGSRLSSVYLKIAKSLDVS
jgi:hypothetical protein